MKFKVSNLTIAEWLVLLATLLFACLPAKAAGTFYRNSLINGTQLVISNNFTFSNTNGPIQPMTYTPNLSEQYPVGFGGGTNWWANGWTTYTNTSGIIVTNPLSGIVTNAAWATDARFYPDGNGNNPSLGVFALLQGPDSTSTNTVTITLGQCVGTNHMFGNAQSFFSFSLTGNGNTNALPTALETNLPTSFVQGCDGVYVAAVSSNNKNTNCYLMQLQLTGWGQLPPE